MIVSNTTPISNLLHLGRIDILQRMFDAVHLPSAVKQEINAAFSEHVTWQQCLHDGFFIIQKVKDRWLFEQLLEKLHIGEAEALCLCMEHSAKLCLLDDKDARNTARQNHISVTGTLGILIEAKKTKQIESVGYYMDELRTHHHFWINDVMYKKVLQLSGESLP
ncbi:MAG: DUF3368 domain-containing protein [bacterium]|nr:DUF3368 domain-containing protein [bacterium]